MNWLTRIALRRTPAPGQDATRSRGIVITSVLLVLVVEIGRAHV
jgi:hypothetical protein